MPKVRVHKTKVGQKIAKISAVRRRSKKHDHAVGAILLVRDGNERKILLLRRSVKDERWPGMWMGGPSETLEEKERIGRGLKRGMEEEIGLLGKVKGKIAMVSNDVKGDVFIVELSKDDLKNIKLASEIEEMKLVSWEELKDMIKKGSLKFQPHWRYIFETMIKKGVRF